MQQVDFPQTRLRALVRCVAAFGRDRAGNIAVLFAIGAPVAMTGVAAGVDYTRYVGAKTSIRSIADGAALAGVQALRLANTSAAAVEQVVTAYVGAHTQQGAPAIAATTSVTGNLVSVQLDQTVPTLVGRLAGAATVRLAAISKARLSGGSLPNCLIALDPSASAAASFDKATLTATGCQIFSGSVASDGLSVANGATVNAGLVCVRGGVKNDGTGAINPAARIDCPAIADPLAGRPQPAVGSCTFNNLKITSGSQTLSPGVYCGGLEIGGNANVNLSAGTYVISGNHLRVKAGGSLSGTDVTIFLTGAGAVLEIENKSAIGLTAPASGVMAGMLIMEDRASPAGQVHKFESRSAPQMLGVIYLPQGVFQVGVKGGGGGSGTSVGASSAWTAVVARRIAVSDQQTLTLNTNYSATPVQPPAGVAPTASAPQLVQ